MTAFRFPYRSLVAATIVGIIVALVLASGVPRPIELPVRDAFLAVMPELEPSRVVVVAIDEASLETLGDWPWSRDRLADVVGVVAKSRPDAIAIDVLLPPRRTDDRRLADSLRGTRSFLVAAFRDHEEWLLPARDLLETAEAVHGILEVDHDGVLRRVATTKQRDGLVLPALSAALASASDPSRAIAVGRELQPLWRVRPQRVPTVSAATLIDTGPSSSLEGRVVLIGATALGIADEFVTPGSRHTPTAGVKIHAALAESMIANDLLRESPPVAAGGLAALVIMACAVLSRRGGKRRLAGEVAVVMAPTILGCLLVGLAHLSIPVVTLTMTSLVAVLAVEIRSALAVHRSVGVTGETLGLGDTRFEAPDERVRRLEEFANQIVETRREEAEAKRVTAHELKTPLTSVRGLAQLLAEFDLDDEEKKRVAKLMTEETQRLQRMIEGLLDLERIKPGELDHTMGSVDLGELASRRLELLGAGTGASFQIEIAKGVRVQGNEILLERMLDNLVGNALKFSPEGSPVTVRVCEHESGALVEIEDRGPGVPEAERKKIFGRFVRGSARPGVTGLGLGLAMVAEIVDRHGGRIEVRSAEPTGAIFRVRLPRVSGED